MAKISRTNELAKALATTRGAFGTVGLFSLFSNLLMLASPLYMMQLYDRVLSSRSEATLIGLTVIVVFLLVIMTLIDTFRSRILVRISGKLDKQINRRVFEAVFKMGLRGGEAGSQPLRDLDTVRQFLGSNAPFAFFETPWIPIFIAINFLFHPLLGLVSLAGAFILFSLAILTETSTRKPLTDASKAHMGSMQVTDASLRNAEVIEAMGMMPGIMRRYEQTHFAALSHQANASDRAGALQAATKATRLILQAAILGTGCFLAIEQIVSPGVMIAASIIMARALAPVEQALGSWKGFVAARESYGRLKNLLGNIPPDPDRMQLPPPQGRISVENATIVPPGSQSPAVRQVSFELEPGEMLGIIGPSASGKSTLARALIGVWPCYGGRVRIDGADIFQWDREELGPHIGYLPQDIELFTGTVKENIARMNDPDPEAVVTAAKIAGVHDMILHLSDGYDTQIGPGGNVLSGGQRQRIGFARAVYGNPSIIVLDEPNSNLDTEGEQALVKALVELKKLKKTAIIIAHRPSVLSVVDKVMILRGGVIQALGPRQEVLRQLAQAAQVSGPGGPGNGPPRGGTLPPRPGPAGPTPQTPPRPPQAPTGPEGGPAGATAIPPTRPAPPQAAPTEAAPRPGGKDEKAGE
ncbi:MAG: type I secretion system permease/ATPase [Alphaproteobacteria bacterium]|nr:type I secretion system permease/ATPase [Alphaproteobacteria bacterium]